MPRIQLHLSTLIVVSLGAGALLWANSWPVTTRHSAGSIGAPIRDGDPYWEHHAYGWPQTAFESGGLIENGVQIQKMLGGFDGQMTLDAYDPNYKPPTAWWDQFKAWVKGLWWRGWRLDGAAEDLGVGVALLVILVVVCEKWFARKAR